MAAFAHNEHRSNNGIQTLWVPSPPPLNLQIALLITSLAGHGVGLLVNPKPSRCLETLNTPSPEFCLSSWESGVGIMRLALQCSHFFPGEKREEGRREGWGGEQGRKGNGLATNCTITTFSKRKNHSVVVFFPLCTICFPLLPPTLQFRGKEERPVLGAHSQWAAGKTRNMLEARGVKWRSGGRAVPPPPCPRPSSLSPGGDGFHT